jgi:hypothetical protein
MRGALHDLASWFLRFDGTRFGTVVVPAICITLVATSITFFTQASAVSLSGAPAVLNGVAQTTSNHSLKGDRLILAGTKLEARSGTKIPVGCERAFSAFAKLNHANVVARCVTAIDPSSKLG